MKLNINHWLSIDSFISSPPYGNNDQVVLMKPFNINVWMMNNEKKLEDVGFEELFKGKFKSKIEIYGQGEHLIEERSEEMFFWQLVILIL